MADRWCPRCGKQCGPHANFCENCGASLSAPAPSAAAPAAPADIAVWRLVAHHIHPEKAAKWSQREGVIAIGWGGIGDLRDRKFKNERELSSICKEGSPGASVNSVVNGGRSLWRLYSEVRQGDLVILSAAGARVAVMQVIGDYFFEDSDVPIYYEHRRPAVKAPMDPDRLWQISGGASPGMGIRHTLIRCARGLSHAEYHTLAR